MEPEHGIKLFGVIIGYRRRGPQEANMRVYRDFIVSKGADEGSLKLVLTRTLTKTDMRAHHNRLSMPRGQIKHNFLNPREEELVQQRSLVGNRDLCKKLKVTVVGPALRPRAMRLSRWNAAADKDEEKSWWYALTHNWKEIARENGLAVGDVVEIWSFRLQYGGLGFIIHKVQT